MILNLSRADAFGVQGDDLIFDVGDVGLVLFDHLRLEFALTVSGNRDLDVSKLAGDPIACLPVAAVGGLLVPYLILGIAQGMLQLSFEHLLQGFSKDVFQHVVDVLHRRHFVIFDVLAQLLIGKEFLSMFVFSVLLVDLILACFGVYT